jgi:hypothetical protein
VDALPLVLAALVGALLALSVSRVVRPDGTFTAGRHLRLPKRLVVEPMDEESLPTDARIPLAELRRRLERLGFTGGPVVRPRAGAEIALVPFVHLDERCVFVMGIEAGWRSRSELMLHIVTPLDGERRVETTSLAALRRLAAPRGVDLRVDLDAGSIEELWSGHRRALTNYERRERIPFPADAWAVVLGESYAAWLVAAVRSQRIQLSPDGSSYRLRRVFT